MNATRVLYVDCFSGASGDMLLGACLDAGLPLEALRDALGGLGVDEIRLTVERVRRAGIEATKVTVADATAEAAAAAAPGRTSTPHARRHRHLPQILQLVQRSNLSASARARAEGLFRRLAEAEAAVHGIPVERVHFHEVGAIDSIVDIVGVVFAFEWFGASRIEASPLNTGSGTVRCDHGVMPVPAPATARLVMGVPIYAEGPATELLTPTGALLVTGHAERYGPMPPMTIERVGYGAGTRDFPDRANVVRLVVGAAADARSGSPGRAEGPGASTERLLVLECEVDDLNPQVFGSLMGRLLAAGARDVFYTAVQMKKGRPGTLVTVLAEPSRHEDLLELLFAETTTLGVRKHEVEREVLARESRTVDTPYGPVRIKLARRGERLVNVAPEFDDCLAVAEARGVPVKDVLAAAVHAWLGGPEAAAGRGVSQD